MPKQSRRRDKEMSMPMMTQKKGQPISYNPTTGEASPAFKRLVVRELIKEGKVIVHKKK